MKLDLSVTGHRGYDCIQSLGSTSISMIEILLGETFKCDAQSVFTEAPPPTAMWLRRTGHRFHYTYLYFICPRITEMEIFTNL